MILRRLFEEERGAAYAEYSLILLLVAVVSMASLIALRGGVDALWHGLTW